MRNLRYVAVAEERHFARAAGRLGIKQPPLSLQIRQLEQELGTALFNRLARGVKLTEAGTQLLDQARQILEQVERANADVQNRARGDVLRSIGKKRLMRLNQMLLADRRCSVAGTTKRSCSHSVLLGH
jgi:DNA-binding transcriptional LysR family regulator